MKDFIELNTISVEVITKDFKRFNEVYSIRTEESEAINDLIKKSNITYDEIDVIEIAKCKTYLRKHDEVRN